MKRIKRYWAWWLMTVILIAYCILPHNPTFAATTKTTSIDVVDDWQQVNAGTLTVGNAKSLSDSYASILYIEVAPVEAVAQEGVTVIVEISYADDNWVLLLDFLTTAETVALTTINDATADAGDLDITLTDATTGDFDVPGRKWFIKSGTANLSESVKARSIATNTVTLCQDLLRSHTNGLTVYDRVDEYPIAIPVAAAQVRVLINNTDADCDVYFTTRVSKMTAI